MRVRYRYYDGSDKIITGEGAIVYWWTRPTEKRLDFGNKTPSGEPRAVVVDSQGQFHDVPMHGLSQILDKA